MAARASSVFGEDDRRRVAEAIAEAERSTAAEIVVVAATRSGRYDRGEDLFGLTLGIVVATVLWLLTRGDDAAAGAQWSAPGSSTWDGVIVLAGFITTFAIGTTLAARHFVLARPFVSREERLAEVQESAVAAFHRFRMSRTTGGTGMLVYVSLAERLVRIVGDDRVNEAVDQSVWDAARDAALAGFKAGRPTDGIVNAIAACAPALAEHVPVADDDENELANEMIVLD